MFFKKKWKLKEIVNRYENEIREQNRIDNINNLENILSENIQELSTNQKFFNLPLINIFSVISKANFDEIEESEDKILAIIQNIIKNIIEKHSKEKETILILQNINKTSFSYEEILSLLELITNCPILVDFCKLYKEQKQLPEKDYEYEINQKKKNKEINHLKQEINKDLFHPITYKPKDFQSNIFAACKEGKFQSVQWLIEKDCVDKNEKVKETNFQLGIFKDDAPIHIATANGNLQIIKYLIENQNVDINLKGSGNWTPLHYACKNGSLPIVEYLISKGAQIDAKNDYWETPLHIASYFGNSNVIRYLVANGANKNSKSTNGRTPYNYAKNDLIRNLLK